MHPDPSEPSSSLSHHSIFGNPDNSSQHGLSHDQLISSASSPLNESAFDDPLGTDSPSVWSLSPSTSASGPGSPADREAGLSNASSTELQARDFRLDHVAPTTTALDATGYRTGTPTGSSSRDDASHLSELPDEMLFQVISHLPAVDLMTVKLVSRRFHTLVTSPLAWMNAFSRFFPGPDSLKDHKDVAAPNRPRDVIVKSEQRHFNRLTSSASWSSEYLTRTRLLRCLERGRPALPFACPAPGKPHKGIATFTFSARLHRGCSNLHADFGTVFDRRKPQFIHGFAATASVSSSDRKGNFDSWGFTDHVGFRHFSETHPSHSLYGLGQGSLVGVPNMMDLSQKYGMVYGEGTPGGTVFHLGAEDRHGITLAPFLNLAFQEFGVPRISQDLQSTCSVWIAKSPAVPQMTRGMIGMLAGSSCGVVSGYSLGPTTRTNQRFARGHLTTRWLLSPGVPIVAIAVDDNYSQDRFSQHRIWAVALNALGEVFYLKTLPEVATRSELGDGAQEVIEESQAWASGNTARWVLTKASLRTSRYRSESTAATEPDYLPSYLFNDGDSNPSRESTALFTWIAKTPGELRSQFLGWDMRRSLLVDFAAEDVQGAGESIFVFSCGHDETVPASIMRYVRSAAPPEVDGPDADAPRVVEPATSSAASTAVKDKPWSFAALAREPSDNLEDSVTTLKPAHAMPASRLIDICQQSNFAFGGFTNSTITATAMDDSHTAQRLSHEDDYIGKLYAQSAESGESMKGQPSSLVPGQRARFLAAGTRTGTIFIWNARAPASQFVTLVNDVQPFRVIHTDSPGISSLAMSALYLVHGGSEGLVQAWDPLASTLEPLRTLSSRQAMSSRRRAVIASQQNGVQQFGHWNLPLSSLAASAVRLDPDPHVLRGVVAIGTHIKYWSYSSIVLADDLSHSQKRRIKRARARTPQTNGFLDGVGTLIAKGRRSHPHSYIDQEMMQHKLERHERAREEQNERRIAGRFGLDLLGEDASEEEMLAYAKLLSEEENERHAKRLEAAEAIATSIRTSEDLEAQRFALSEEDAQKWKFASWEERYKMLPESMTPDPTNEARRTADDQVDDEIQRALELSLHDDSHGISTAESPDLASSSASRSDDPDYDPDLAEAIALSMSESEARASSSPGIGSSPFSSEAEPQASSQEDDELARAIQISIQTSASSNSSTGDGAATPTNTARSRHMLDNDSFPALSPNPSPTASPALKPAGAWATKGGDSGKGKGKERG